MTFIENIENPWLFLSLIPLAAMLYSSVGHGGASAYLALMALFSFPPIHMKAAALHLNLFVAGVAFLQFYRLGHFKWNVFLPFAIGSVPAAFFGARLPVDPGIYKLLLACFLIFASIRMFMPQTFKTDALKSVKFIPSIFIGMVIGFVSGLIGIGGGIILSPLLLLLKIADIKTTAAVSALFIWINSVSGIGGMMAGGMQFESWYYILAAIAFCGGLVGSYLGAAKFDRRTLNNLLAMVLMIAGAKLLFT